jgi:hypothetical protein
MIVYIHHKYCTFGYAYSIVYLYTAYDIFVLLYLYLTEKCYIYIATVFLFLFAADVLYCTCNYCYSLVTFEIAFLSIVYCVNCNRRKTSTCVTSDCV